jgi:parallel beta-helix repeat protein
MVAPGTYYEHDIDFLGKTISVMGTDPEDSAVVAATVVNGDSLGTVFIFQSGEDTTSILSGLTVSKGYRFRGGGIYCASSSPKISHNIIENNKAGWGGGGGIFCTYSSAIIRDNTIRGNSDRSRGGGGILCADSSSTSIINNIITRNSAQGHGGGIQCDSSTISVIHNIVKENSARDHGGGVYFTESSNGAISDNTIIDNSARSYCGGIGCDYSSLTIENNYIAGNSASGFGGGIGCMASNSIIANNVISGNSAGYGGGGIFSGYSASVTITNCTIVDNWADLFGGGITCWDNSSSIITNSILVGNESSDSTIIWIGHESSPSSLSIGYSNLEGGIASIYLDEGSNLNWGDGMIDTDPLFRNIGNGDYHLKTTLCGDDSESPCIDAGDPSISDLILDCLHGLGTTRSDMGAYGGQGYGPLVSIKEDYPKSNAALYPRTFNLFQNFPNPFNPSTTISFNISNTINKRQRVNLNIYDIRGRLVSSLIDSDLEPGTHKIHWDGRNDRGVSVSSGIYLYQLKSGGETFTRKMTVLK